MGALDDVLKMAICATVMTSVIAILMMPSNMDIGTQQESWFSQERLLEMRQRAAAATPVCIAGSQGVTINAGPATPKEARQGLGAAVGETAHDTSPQAQRRGPKVKKFDPKNIKRREAKRNKALATKLAGTNLMDFLASPQGKKAQPIAAAGVAVALSAESMQDTLRNLAEKPRGKKFVARQMLASGLSRPQTAGILNVTQSAVRHAQHDPYGVRDEKHPLKTNLPLDPYTRHGVPAEEEALIVMFVEGTLVTKSGAKKEKRGMLLPITKGALYDRYKSSHPSMIQELVTAYPKFRAIEGKDFSDMTQMEKNIYAIEDGQECPAEFVVKPRSHGTFRSIIKRNNIRFVLDYHPYECR